MRAAWLRDEGGGVWSLGWLGMVTTTSSAWMAAMRGGQMCMSTSTVAWQMVWSGTHSLLWSARGHKGSSSGGSQRRCKGV